MKAIIIGLGTQGYKRKKVLIDRKSYVCSFDPFNNDADEKNISKLEKYKFDTVFLCCPDKYKKKYITIFLKWKKNILVEKPLTLSNRYLKKIERISNINNKFFYIAYNHRFEPHFEGIKKLIDKEVIGKLYFIKFFYGNGTARLVNSGWRKNELGILEDIGSHLIDICHFWLKKKKLKIEKSYFKSFENNSHDYGNIFLHFHGIIVNFEFTYCSWKNTFNCKILGKKGSLIMNGLCKWGPSILENQKRILPSGKPKISRVTLKKKDPTWKKEVIYFEKCIKKNLKVNLDKEIYLNNLIKKIKKLKN